MKLRPLTSRIIAAGLVSFAAIAQAGSPRATVIFPSGGQRGAEIEVEVRGNNLADAKTMLFDAPGFEITPVKAEGGKFTAKVKVPADAHLGEHTFRVITASGVSDVRLFYVSPFPMVAEVEPKANEADKPQPVALGTTVYGRTQSEDQDRFIVEAKKGQRISAEVLGSRFSTQQIYDPFLTIAKEDGTQLAEVDDTAFTRQDPVASVIAPADGKYIIMVKEATNAGIGDCQYLLNIGSFPRPVAAYPPGGQTGEELKVKLLGDASGPIEKTVKLPAEPDERFELYTEADQPAPQPNFLRVSPFPNILEAEPNNETAKGTPAGKDLPLAFNGIIEQKGDVDYFKFTAKKGQAYDLNVFARKLRSPVDPVLTIHDAKGNRIQLNDDSGHIDSYLRWTAPADGEFLIGVKDQLDRGGPIFTYRVEVKPVEPRLTVWLPDMVINSNQERRAIVVPKGNRYASLVRIKRMDVGGPVELTPSELPAGVTAHGNAIDKTVDTIPMVFEATPDAASAAQVFAVEAKPLEPPQNAVVKSAVEHDIDVAENGNQRAFYSVRENRLPVAVTDEIPVKINLVQPTVPLLQSGSMNLKVVAERKNEFKGPINLALLYSPPGIGSAGTFKIEEGKDEGIVPISANANAAAQKWKVCVVGNADFGKGAVWFSTQLIELDVAAPFVAGQIVRSFVDQGDQTTITVKLDQKLPFEGKAKLELVGLPPNVTAEPKEITKDDKEVQFTVKAGPNAPAGQHKQMFCQFQLTKEGGETMTSAFAQGGILRIDKATVAKK